MLACRDETKGEEAKKEILSQAGRRKPGKVEVWALDMSNFTSVLAFGDRLNTLPRLDAFLANAGIDTVIFERFEDWESTLTVNVISTFLVVMLAIPKLRETAKVQQSPSRLVFTGSVVHIFAQNRYLSQPGPGQIFRSLNDETTADMEDRYLQSKLLVLLGIRQLAGDLDRTSTSGTSSVIVTCVNPGWCKTELFRTHDGGFGGRMGLRLIGRTAEVGSRTLVHAVTANEKMHGKYLSECRIKPESSWVRSKESVRVEKDVWAELVDILEGIKPGVTKL